MKKLYPLLSVFFLIGCSKDLDNLEKRGDIYYEINSEEPFSGSIINKYESGQKHTEGILTNGKEDGLWTWWYQNEQKKKEVTYKNGELDGLTTWWHGNGQKRYEWNYKAGEYDGLYTRWYPNGQKRVEGTWKDDDFISKECWDEGGNECECGEEYFGEGCK